MQVKMLLKAGAEVDLRIDGRQYKKETALMNAAKMGQLEVVEVLLDAGAERCDTLPSRGAFFRSVEDSSSHRCRPVC